MLKEVTDTSREKVEKKRPKAKYFDYSLLVIMLFLIVFGLVMIYSTSYYSGLKYGSATFFLEKQIRNTLIGAFFFVICIFFDYRFYYKFAPYIYVFSIICIALVLTPLGIERNGATRWIGVDGMSFQPAELSKLAIVLAAASYNIYTGSKYDSMRSGIIYFIMIFIPAFLIFWLTDNASSALIVGGIGAAMYFVGTKNKAIFIIVITAGVLLVGGILAYVIFNIDPAHTGHPIPEGTNFRLVRIVAWMHPEDYSTQSSYQTLQSLYALGSGGIFGKGLGQSIQKLGFIPEAQNDMIFAVVCEELGVFGGILLILLFVLLIYRFMVIALNAPDRFGAMLVVGIAAQVAIQVILNIAVVTNVFPNTGVSLPFISYGGTSVLFLMAEMGIALNVSRHIKYTK